MVIYLRGLQNFVQVQLGRQLYRYVHYRRKSPHLHESSAHDRRCGSDPRTAASSRRSVRSGRIPGSDARILANLATQFDILHYRGLHWCVFPESQGDTSLIMIRRGQEGRHQECNS